MGKFTITGRCKKARTGTLNTRHGKVKTPFFMPVATKGSVKLLSNEEMLSTGTECMISNSFILWMKPGLEVIEKHKGLQGFMNWPKILFTDSGGFQVLSDTFCLSLKEEGVLFRNPFTGKKMLFTPELSMQIQEALGNDVAMCLDDVPKADATPQRVLEAVERTSRWAQRCYDAHADKKQMLFGIIQGGIDKKLRKKSAEEITAINFDGYALGGLAIGEPLSKMMKIIEYTLAFVPKEKPRYLMGVGSVKEIIKSVALGVDCFDSRFPTRTARHGKAFTRKGYLNIDNAKHRFDTKPIEEKCECFVCKNHSRAFLHHLFRTKEENAHKYLSLHNTFFVQELMKTMRKEIEQKTFSEKKLLKEYAGE